jgi:hypothetical protein
MSDPIWTRPFCRVKSTVSRFSVRARVALEAYGRCHVCGTQCDAGHSYPNAPLICDRCCPLCNPRLAEVS